jgi:hypothetical protein
MTAVLRPRATTLPISTTPRRTGSLKPKGALSKFSRGSPYGPSPTSHRRTHRCKRCASACGATCHGGSAAHVAVGERLSGPLTTGRDPEGRQLVRGAGRGPFGMETRATARPRRGEGTFWHGDPCDPRPGSRGVGLRRGPGRRARAQRAACYDLVAVLGPDRRGHPMPIRPVRHVHPMPMDWPGCACGLAQ